MIFDSSWRMCVASAGRDCTANSSPGEIEFGRPALPQGGLDFGPNRAPPEAEVWQCSSQRVHARVNRQNQDPSSQAADQQPAPIRHLARLLASPTVSSKASAGVNRK